MLLTEAVTVTRWEAIKNSTVVGRREKSQAKAVHSLQKYHSDASLTTLHIDGHGVQQFSLFHSIIFWTVPVDPDFG